MKDLRAESKRHADLIEKQAAAFDKLGQDCRAQFGRIDRRFEHLESKMDEELQALLQNSNGKQPHGGASSSTENTPSHCQPFKVRNAKLDFPRFDGADVLYWIFQAEQYFDYYETPDHERIVIAAVHMDKKVLNHFESSHQFNSISLHSEIKIKDSITAPIRRQRWSEVLLGFLWASKFLHLPFLVFNLNGGSSFPLARGTLIYIDY